MLKPIPSPASPVARGASAETGWLVLLAIFLSSYLTWRPSQEIMFTASDALFLLALVQLAYRKRIPLEPMRLFTSFWIAGFGLLIGGLLIGSLNCPTPTRWLIVSVQYLFAWVVLPLILLRRPRAQTTMMIKAFVWGVFMMNLFGAIVYYTYTGTFEQARALFGMDFLSGGRRLGAFTGDANWNGACLAMAIPLVIFLRAKALVGNLSTMLWLPVLLFGVMLTASFTAFTCCVVALAIFAWVGRLRPSPRLLAVIIAAAAVSLVVYVELGLSLPKTFEARVGNAVGNGDISEAGTYVGRMKLMQEAWSLVPHHELVGMGADQYRVISEYQAPVHNMYLLLWAEGGLPSLVGWLAMISILLASAIRVLPRDRLAAALTLSITATFIVSSMASPHMYARLWAVPVLLALAVSLQVPEDGKPPIRRRRYAALINAAA